MSVSIDLYLAMFSATANLLPHCSSSVHFALFQFPPTRVQSQTCDPKARTQNLLEKTPWKTSKVAEKAWRGRRRDPECTASLSLKMKARFLICSQPTEFTALHAHTPSSMPTQQQWIGTFVCCRGKEQLLRSHLISLFIDGDCELQLCAL